MARYNVTANCISPFAWTRHDRHHPDRDAGAEGARREAQEDVAPRTSRRWPSSSPQTTRAKEIAGQIFGVRGKEILLFCHLRPVRAIHRDDGWTPERLAEMFPGTLGHHLVPLETSGQYFNYDPLV